METTTYGGLVSQADTHIPFFFKQWGGVNKKKAGRLLDGRTYDEMPETRLKILSA
jgi:protein gp37